MAFFELVNKQQYGGQLIVNRYTYRSSSTPATASLSYALFHAWSGAGPANSFTGSVLGAVRAMQCEELVHTGVEVFNLYDPVDFVSYPFSPTLPGLMNNENDQNLPPMIAYGFKSARARRDIRGSTRRIAGVGTYNMTASDVQNPFLPAFVNDVLNVAAAMFGDTLEYDDEGTSLSFVPVTIKREKYTAPSGRDAYRFPLTEADADSGYMEATSWSAYPTLRTQNSRQFGSGA